MNFFKIDNEKFSFDELVGSFKEYLKLYYVENNAVIKEHLKKIVEEYISVIKALLDKVFVVEEKKDEWS